MDRASVSVTQELADLYKLYRPMLPTSVRWEDERDRWLEFLFAVVLECSGLPTARARTTITALANLGTLEPERIGSSEPLIRDALVSVGATPEAADTTAKTLLALTSGMDEAFGKHQRFLRWGGQMMLAELERTISLPSIPADARGRIFTTWLQNALELPLSSTWADKAIDKFARAHDVEPSTLVESADALDINVALLDDLVRFHEETQGDETVMSEAEVREPVAAGGM